MQKIHINNLKNTDSFLEKYPCLFVDSFDAASFFFYQDEKSQSWGLAQVEKTCPSTLSQSFTHCSSFQKQAKGAVFLSRLDVKTDVCHTLSKICDTLFPNKAQQQVNGHKPFTLPTTVTATFLPLEEKRYALYSAFMKKLYGDLKELAQKDPTYGQLIFSGTEEEIYEIAPFLPISQAMPCPHTVHEEKPLRYVIIDLEKPYPSRYEKPTRSETFFESSSFPY
ncbi:hypothetical protein OAN22_01570 [Alphaproteobacteria bacterium]|nr:hypothetical protein [Alphaproteobacteria bacterium]